MKILIIIPAHNEARTIGDLTESLRTFGYDVLVIDDGSIDGTDVRAAQAGAKVIKTGGKTGKGNALRVGFQYVLGHDYEALIAMDGDGQHAPADVAAFVACSQKLGADIVNGDRMHNPQDMPWLRRATNWFMSWIISVVCGQPIPDTQCGFRLIKTSALRSITLESSDFEIETEVLIKASKKHFKIASVPVQSIYRNEISKINPMRDTWRFVVYLARELFARHE